jgi:hypothetical protein
MINYKTLNDVRTKSDKLATVFEGFRKALAEEKYESSTPSVFFEVGALDEKGQEFVVSWCGRRFAVSLDRFPTFKMDESGEPYLSMKSGEITAHQLLITDSGDLGRVKLKTLKLDTHGNAEVQLSSDVAPVQVTSNPVPAFLSLIGISMDEELVWR